MFHRTLRVTAGCVSLLPVIVLAVCAAPVGSSGDLDGAWSVSQTGDLDRAWSVSQTLYRAELHGGRFTYYSDYSNYSEHSRHSQRPDFACRLTRVSFGSTVVEVNKPRRLLKSGNVACSYYGGVVSESYTASPEGVEQCWVINSRQAPGPIVIESEIRSPHTADCCADHWRFIDARGRTVLRYGLVTVVDARGRTVTCIPQFDGDSLKITIPADYTSSAAFPILVDPVVGPEVPICPTFGPAPGDQQDVEIAAGSAGGLAVWQDARGTNGLDIFGSRVSADGQALDILGIAISTSAADQTDPAVAWNGQHYLVVWSDRRQGIQHIYGARLNSTGEVIDKQGILISGENGVQAYPKVASDGSGWFVVWQDGQGSSPDIYGRKVNADGSLGAVYGIVTLTSNQETPDVAWTGSEFMVVWRDYRNSATTGTDIYGCRVSRTGIRMGSDIIVSCDATGLAGSQGEQRAPRICSFGSGCMVVWEDLRNDPERSDIYGARVASSGTVWDKGGLQISVGTGNRELPDVSFNGSNLLVVWRHRTDRLVKGTRISQAGAILDPDGIVVSYSMAGSGGISTVGIGGKFVVGWHNLAVLNSDVVAAVVKGDGNIQPPGATTISLALDDQDDYCVADSGTEYAVVWSQVVNGQYDILGARISHSGVLLTPNAVNITGSYAGDQTQPSIAWNGSHYLVVWRGNESFASSSWDIRGCRLDSALEKVDGTPIAVCTAIEEQQHPFVTSNNNNFLVVWQDSRNAISPDYYCDVYGAIISPTGSVSASLAVGLGYADQRTPRAASDGTNYFVVWEDYRSGLPAVYGTRVTSSGQALDPAGIAMPATSYYQVNPDICFGGDYYLVTWSDWYEITACRLTTGGVILDTEGITIDSGSKIKLYPSAWWDGAKYQVVWEDYRSQDPNNADIYYSTVSSSGGVPPEAPMALVSDLAPQLRPCIRGGESEGMLFYSKYYNYSNSVCAAILTEPSLYEVDTIAEAKTFPAGTSLALEGKIVTAAFDGYFYIQEPDRSAGIRVNSAISVAVDDIVDVTGIIGISDGERAISATDVQIIGTAEESVEPLGMRGDLVGGGSLNAYTPGITGGVGTHNIGLLVTTWGTVTSVSSQYFYIESRPALSIKVKCGSMTKPLVGDFAAVTGISSCETVSGAISRVILPRTQNDIRILE